MSCYDFYKYLWNVLGDKANKIIDSFSETMCFRSNTSLFTTLDSDTIFVLTLILESEVPKDIALSFHFTLQ
jgi:hypothetical protein